MTCEEETRPAVPEWFVTFSDMMALLLTFFIMLVSMSEIKQDGKFEGVAESIRQQFGSDLPPLSFAPGAGGKRDDASDGDANVAAAAGDFPKVRIIRPGSQTAVGTVIFFAEVSAELSPQCQAALLSTALQLGGKPQKIEVRGHTSQRPAVPSGNVADNWDLAYRRCHNTTRFLVETMKIDPCRVRMSVAGPHEPLVLDGGANQQRQNPRVEVFLLDELVSETRGPPAETRPESAEAKPSS